MASDASRSSASPPGSGLTICSSTAPPACTLVRTAKPERTVTLGLDGVGAGNPRSHFGARGEPGRTSCAGRYLVGDEPLSFAAGPTSLRRRAPLTSTVA